MNYHYETQYNKYTVLYALLPLARELYVFKTTPVAAKSHALILKVTFPPLVTNGAIKRMVYQQELHHTFPCLAGHFRIRFDSPPFHHRHGTCCYRLNKSKCNFFILQCFYMC